MSRESGRRGGHLGGRKGGIVTRDRQVGVFDPSLKNLNMEWSSRGGNVSVQRGRHKGLNNSQYGTMWITNGQENKKIKKDDSVPEGWRKGRIV